MQETLLERLFHVAAISAVSFNVHNRAQAYSTMKLLFNAIYYR